MTPDNTRPEHDLQDEHAPDAGPEAHAAADPNPAAADPMDQHTSENDGADAMTMQEQDQHELVAQLEQAQTKADDYLDSLQRERANFQNYKKRVERERTEQAQAVQAQMLLKLLPVLDDFYRAMDAVPDAAQDSWFAGVELILRRLERYLADHNVTEIEAAGQPFDPNYHEAIGLDAETDADSGTITDVLLRGYRHGERVLRPAMVRVAE